MEHHAGKIDISLDATENFGNDFFPKKSNKRGSFLLLSSSSVHMLLLESPRERTVENR